MNKIKKGDQVIILCGKDKGKQGLVLSVFPSKNKVLVENVNVYKKHTKPNPQAGIEGGIVDKTLPIDISNVSLINPKTNKPSRVGFMIQDGVKKRVFKPTNELVK